MPSNADETSGGPTTSRSRTFRLFVSSTFQDLRTERNALHAHVFPRLREMCRRYDCRFQAIDLRWGVSEQAALDQQTMTICLGEIERCHRVTPRPNFLVLLGDRYGWLPPPPRIAASQFDALLDRVSADDAELLRWEAEQPDEGKGWYRRDENANPTEYRLRPRHLDLSRCETRDEEEAARRGETAAWGEIEVRLQRALEGAAEKSSLPAEACLEYERSATEQEITVGALQVEDPKDKVFCFFRSLSGLPDGFRPREFLAFVKGRCEERGRALSSAASGCLESIRSLPDDGSPRHVRDLIVDAREEVPKESNEAADLKHLEAWLREVTAYDYLDLNDDWQPDTGAAARLEALKEKLRQRVPANVYEYEARWTEEGPSTDHLGTLPEGLDECLALLEAPEPPDTLCAAVWRRLAGTILKEIEHPTALLAAPDEKIHVQLDDGLDPEGRAHCKFANGLLRFFVGRGEPLQAIRDYLTGEEQRVLAVAAEGGAGKSALMAKALEEATDAHANAQIVYRFIGATPSSSDGRSLLVSLCREISRRYGEDEEVPYDYTELASELEKRMAPATADRPLILLLDALDQLSEAHGARSLTWLPRQLPEGVRVVISTRRGAETFAAVTRLQPEEVEVGPMEREEGEELLGLWLDDAGRTLTQEQRTKVLDAFEEKRSGGRPLYLKLAFEEARLWPSYVPGDQLGSGVDGVIRENLFDRLAREESHGEALVAHTVGYLAASRFGLAEDELLDVLSRDADLYASFLKGSYHLPSDLVAQAIEYRRSRGVKGGGAQKDEVRLAETWLLALVSDTGSAAELRSFLDEVLPRRDGPRLPVVLWSRLFFDLAPYLTERQGDGTSLLAFYHRELNDVGAEEYAHDERGRVLHGRLADYFRFRADPERNGTWTGSDVRGLSELPYHLTEAARWQELHDTLTDFRFLEHKAAEVGVEETTDTDGKTSKLYTGVLQLQDDFDHALEKMPGGGGAAGGRRPLIVTAVDFGGGHVVRCPWCSTAHAVTKERKREWLGQEIICPNDECSGPLKVNPFVCERPSWAGKRDA
jgi:hypothetical protein